MKKPNKKKVIILTSIIIAVAVVVAIAIIMFSGRANGNIPDGYIAVFHGGGTEVTRETYIYKEDNDHANYGFTYINTETIRGINPENVTTNILKRGSFDWTDGAFTVAKENNAYTYVTTPNSNQMYTIEEFMSRFLMD